SLSRPGARDGGPDGRPHRLRLRFGVDVAAAAREQFHQSHRQHGLAPPGGPAERRDRARVRRLNQAMGEALDTPYVRERFEALGEEIAPPERRRPDYFAKFVAGEIARWSGPIKASGVSAD